MADAGDVRRRLVKIVGGLGGDAPAIAEETPMDGILADELDQVGLTIAIEDEFGIGLQDTEVGLVRSFGELVEMVSRKLGH